MRRGNQRGSNGKASNGRAPFFTARDKCADGRTCADNFSFLIFVRPAEICVSLEPCLSILTEKFMCSGRGNVGKFAGGSVRLNSRKTMHSALHGSRLRQGHQALEFSANPLRGRLCRRHLNLEIKRAFDRGRKLLHLSHCPRPLTGLSPSSILRFILNDPSTQLSPHPPPC